MDLAALEALVEGVRTGTVAPDDAVSALRRLPFADLGFARIDHHRALRQGMPETIYGPGKAPEHCAAIVTELLSASDGPVLLSRADRAQVDAVLAAAPSGTVTGLDRPGGPCATVVWRPAATRPERVMVVTAGTADLAVADECAATLAAYGFAPQRLNDVGVAGVHRLLEALDDLTSADAVVVVAGMEGALPSVVGGIVGAPVVAVPTSVGYGAALDGITALLGMLASCAAGITVVGIDNGFGAASAVARLVGARRG